MSERQDRSRRISQRARSIEPFLAMEVFERAAALERSGKSIVHLEVGEPDFDTPEVVREAALRALREGHTHYTHSLGRPELREAIVAWYGKHYGVTVSPERVVVTMGSSAAMLLVCAALLEPGNAVIMTNPHYACYPKFVTTFGGKPLTLPVSEAHDFHYGPDQLPPHLEKAAAVILNSPANPTGTLMSGDRMADLAETISDRAVVISDEIYHGLVYEGRAHSILEYDRQAVVINGFSKLFAMTGWRLGYAILPEFLVRPVQKLQQNLFISPADFVQIAAVAALTLAGEDVRKMCNGYNRRRKCLLTWLEEAGLEVPVRPSGAFYVFVKVVSLTTRVVDWTFRLLEEAGVAVAPGVDFGSGGEGYIRISYANSLEQIEEGIRRMRRFLERTSG